jgi:2-polyprenyl-3-methyl-5-hydroxy-6-metoxy-1,4-benzoquinol methylase
MNLKRYRPGAWSGCDFSESAIEKAKILFKDVRFYYCSSHDMLGEIGEKFDTVVCSEVLEHVPEDEQFASELVRIAEKRIVITTPRIKVDDPGHLRIYTRKTLSDLFPEKTAGIKEDGPFFYMVVVI